MADASSAINYSYSVILGDGPPWGIRLQGGHEFAQRLRVAKVNPNSKAYRQGVQTGDLVDTINGVDTDGMNHRDALRLFQNSNGKLVLELTRTKKQSAIPILRVESPADLRPLESDLDRADSSEYLYDDTAQGMASGSEDLYLASEPEMNSHHHHQPSSAWSQNGFSQKNVYHPVPFGTRANNSAAPSKGYESADEILASKSFVIPVKSQESPGRSHPSGAKRRHPRHLSDPGFDSKQSLRPPISSVIQLSRRSRQFNFWNHFYPRNSSDPGVLAPTADPEGGPASIPSGAARPPVFTSVEEFQRHYGLCYARSLPLRRRCTTRSTVVQDGSPPSNPPTRRVQFAPGEPQDAEEPPFYDSDDAVAATLPKVVTHPRGKTVASLLPPDESRTRPRNENLSPCPIVVNSRMTENSPSLPGQSNNLDNVTSSLKISLNSSSNVDETENKAKICNQKFLKGRESAANKVVNSNSPRVAAGGGDDDDDDDGALTSFEFELPLATVGTATARLDFAQSELPKSQSQTLKLLKKSPADATCTVAQPQTVQSDRQRASQPIKIKAIHSQSNPKASRSNITSIQTTARATRPSGPPAGFASQDLLDLIGDLSSNRCDSHLDEKNNEKNTLRGIIEISPPCGFRCTSRTDRTKDPSTVSQLSADKTECFRSTLPATMFQNNEVNKQEKFSTTDRMLSPRLSDPNLVRDRNSQYFNDEYWLELAGLGNACTRNDQSSVGQSKISAALSTNKSSALKAIALYSFKAKSDRELSFARGDIISILRPVDKNWYEAELNAAVGLVPCSYVKITNDLENKREKEKQEKEKLEKEKQEKILVRVKAKHDFTAKFPAELSFNSGDILTVIRRIDGNWYEGRLNQRTGIFPVSYVEPLTEPSLTSTHQTALMSGSSALSPVNAVPLTETWSRDAPRDAPRDAHKDTLHGLSKDVLEFDKLFENYGNLDTTKNNQKTFVDDDKQLFTLPSAKWNRAPVDSKFNTISVSSSIRNDSLSSDAVRNNPHSVQQQKIQPEPSGGRSATPSLHLLYEEPWYQVLYNYSPEHDDELDLCEGDLIYLLESCDDGWCVGRSDRTKRVGTFPGNYVKQLG